MSGGMITSDVSGKADTVMSVNGDMVDFESSARTRLPIGSDTNILTVSSSLPVWAAPVTQPAQTNVQYDVAAMSGVDFDFDSTDAVQTISISAATAFTGSNYAAGKSITLFITTDGSERGITFPSGWIFQGTMPTTQAASKVGTLTLLCSSTTEASVRAAYAVEE